MNCAELFNGWAKAELERQDKSPADLLSINPILIEAFQKSIPGWWIADTLARGTQEEIFKNGWNNNPTLFNVRIKHEIEEEIYGEPPSSDMQANSSMHTVHDRSLEGKQGQPVQGQGQSQGSWVRVR